MTSPFIPSSFTYGDAPQGGQVMPMIIASRNPSNIIDTQYASGYWWLSDIFQGGSGNMYYQGGNSAGVPAWTLVANSGGVLNTLSDGTITVAPLGGNIAIVGTANQVIVTGNAATHQLVLGLAGSVSFPGSVTVGTTLAVTGNATVGGTLGVTGATTLAALSATSGTFSTTLGVTGTTTLAAVNATNGTFSGTLGVTGATTIAALSATSGTFSSSLGVTGLTTLAALTQTGTTLINASGAGVTTIGTGGTGATNIGNATGNTVVTGSLRTTTTLTASLGAITATNGNLVLGTAGNKILSTSVGTTTAAGANSFGSVALVGGTATVATTAVTANSLIFLTCQALGTVAVASALCVSAKTGGVSFVITASQGTDTSTIAWFIVN